MKLSSSNYAACLARIAARGTIGQEEARAILEEVSEAADRMRATGVDEPIVTAAWDLARKLKTQKALDRTSTLVNATKRQARITELMAANGSAHPLRAREYWTPGMGPTENASSLGAAIGHEWKSVMHRELKKAGLLKAARDPGNFVEIAKAIGEVRGIPGAVASADVYRNIAKIIVPLQDAMRTRLNAEMGAPRISKAADYIASTSHDPWLMRRGGRGMDPTPNYNDAFTAWRAEAERTFDPFDPVIARAGETQADADTRFWKAVFDAKYTGIHMRAGETTLTPTGHLPSASSSRYEIAGGNLAKRLAESRVLKPKSPELWAQYMQKYGTHRNWYSLMDASLGRAGRNAGLMHFFGDNPSANLRLIIRSTEEQLRKKDPDLAVKFMKDVTGRPFIQPGVEQVMSRLDGSAENPQNEMFHTINATIRGFYDMVYLGSVAFTHAASLISTFPSEARMHGINTFASLGKMMKSMVPENLSYAERGEVLAALQAYGDGVSRYGHDAFAHGWNLPGVVSAVHNRFMDAGALPYVFDHARWGMREMLSNNLARQTGKEFGALNPRLQTILKRYGINEGEWDLLRAAGPDIKTPNGLVYLTPRAGLAASADPAIGRDLADRLAMYYHDAADHATVTAGVRERSLLHTTAGTWQDEMLQHLLQFKTWPLAAMHQVLAREIYGNLTWGKAAWGVGTVAALSMLGGYLRLAASDLVSGRQLREPKNVGDAYKIAVHSLAQGGGLGILGDFLFGEVDRLGQSAGEVGAGPALGDVLQLAGIFNKWQHDIGTDKKGDVWPELARWGVHHIPFSNLFYLKGAFEYLALFHILEALRPGWWGRMNRQMEKAQGRTMQGYTPGSPPPYGIPGIYLGGARPSGLLAH